MSILRVTSSPATILIVDDINNNFQILYKYLTDAGYKVLFAPNSTRAVGIAMLARPDLILLDAVIPKVNGFDVCYLLKNNSKTKDIPVVLMTDYTFTSERVKRLDLGVVDYISKPIECLELLARISTHLKLGRLNKRIETEARNKQLVWDITDCIRKSLDWNSILQTAVTEIIKVLQCDRLSVVRLRNENIVVEAQSIANQTISKLPKKLNFNYYYALVEKWQDYCEGKVRVIEKIESCHETKGDMQAQLIVPILLEETTPKASAFYPLWGWLIAEQKSPRMWQPETVELLRSLTLQLAIALQQSMLYQKIEHSNQQLQISNRQLKATNQKLEQLALLDPLTQIFNRRYFDRQLNKEWRRLLRNAPGYLSLILCDVDCFKLYNDTYGHRQGDKCLQKVAQAIAKVLKRPADILARYGGEEFVVALPDTPQAGAIAVAEAMRVAVKDLQIPHVNSSVDSVVTVSLGVANTIPNTDNNSGLSIDAADRALYTAKNRGRDCLAVYQGDVSQSRELQNNELHWSQRIRQALEQNLFSLYAQPIVPLDDRDRTLRFEILLRLTDLEGIAISPNSFFEIAARNSLMPTIDTWVVNNLFQTIAESNCNNWKNHHYSINLSGASLNNPSFLKYLAQKLADVNLPGDMFCFEITETIAIDNLASVSQFINSVKKIGCSFALDDFGKGMSSLSYLKDLPIDYLKIDGSLITGLHQDKISKTIVEGIHHIAEGMGLKTVAEFVENQDILNTLRDLKVDYAQGYHLGRPGKLVDILG